MYKITSKSDLSTGATLIVRVPEDELDKKALYTILADKPDFVLPFVYRLIDDQVEFTYQIENRYKLPYLYGERSTIEYTELWISLLQPIIECTDWFMNPYSFVFNTEYLFLDKKSGKVSFVYIPAVKPYSDFDALKDMVMEISKQNRVTDVNLENKVLRSIHDFRPKEFIKMIKLHRGQNLQAIPAQSVKERGQNSQQPAKQAAQPIQPIKETQPINPPYQPSQPSKKQSPILGSFVEPNTNNSDKFSSNKPLSDEILINFPSDVKTKKDKKSNKSIFGLHKKKEEKVSEKKGFSLGGQKPIQQEGVKENVNIRNRPIIDAPIYVPPQDGYDDVTQIDFGGASGARLEYMGNSNYPKVINIKIAEGDNFTIGRFDVSVGRQQSNFEFDQKTKAVSRRHAVVERRENGYSIVDMSSSAGTFLNGQKIPPNTPFKLERGCRVSFGNAGADYVWEE